MALKDKRTAGADERTPSRAQYFSWISNTNEGASDEQTLANLDYFRWLRDTYGMQLDIYALDAGNLDGSAGVYYADRKDRVKEKYPEGYRNIAEAAARIGAKLGMWCGPDGFGDTQDQADARRELMVSLCRDYGFGMFKMDGVCSGLRPEKQDEFCRMMEECHKYQPDLILLNHRLDLGEGLKYATTFLWQGGETYVDVHTANDRTAPHHRGFVFTRGEVEGLQRLAEDHGVCLSSCMDRFDDDLVYQAFNRDLILSPEIYGNPWLLKDSEQTALAHIYNLHRAHRDILVDGMLLDAEKYGENAVSRGTGEHRFLTFGNPSWKKKTVNVRLDGEIGLERCDRASVVIHHPYTHLSGVYAYGETVPVTVDPFRAVLLEICPPEIAPELVSDRPYRVTGKNSFRNVDTEYDIVRLGTAAKVPVPADAVKLAETALFAMDNDSLEARSLRRAGETSIPEVRRARDMFFSQKTYLLRGCEGRFAFDGRKDTFFDGISRFRWGGMRFGGGCLRVDLGRTFDADRVEFEFFEPDVPTKEVSSNTIPEYIDTSADLMKWKKYTESSVSVLGNETVEAVSDWKDDIYKLDGSRRVLSYRPDKPFRYIRMPSPLSRIYRISLFKNDEELIPDSPSVNNLMPSVSDRPVIGAQKTVVRVGRSEWRPGSYLSVALEGVHGIEGAYPVIECCGELTGASDRAPSFISNVWEYRVRQTDRNNTYYFPVTEKMIGRDLTVWVLLFDGEHTDFTSDVYLCPSLE